MDTSTSRHALRLTGGIALPIIVGEALGWTAPFIASVFALQLLAPRQLLTPVAALVTALVVTLAFAASLLLTAIALPYPLVFAVGLGLALFGALYGQARNGSPFWFFLLLALAATPLLAAGARDQAEAFAHLVVRSMVIAIVATWLMHAFFPEPLDAPRAAPPEKMEPSDAARNALIGTLVLLPLVIVLLGQHSVAVVVCVTAISILKAATAQGGAQTAKGLVLANVIAGIAAVAAYAVIMIAPTLLMLTVVVLTLALAFAGRVAPGGEAAALAAAACAAALVLLGSSLNPYLDATTQFGARLVNVLITSVYTAVAYFVLDGLLRRVTSPRPSRSSPAPS